MSATRPTAVPARTAAGASWVLGMELAAARLATTKLAAMTALMTARPIPLAAYSGPANAVSRVPTETESVIVTAATTSPAVTSRASRPRWVGLAAALLIVVCSSPAPSVIPRSGGGAEQFNSAWTGVAEPQARTERSVVQLVLGQRRRIFPGVARVAGSACRAAGSLVERYEQRDARGGERRADVGEAATP